MKRYFALASLALALLTVIPMVGCKTQTPPPAWAITAPQRTVGDIISSATSMVVQYEQNQKDCTAAPALTKCPGVANVQLHTVMQDIQKSLTVANPAYKKWAAALKANPSAPESADLAGAISAIQTLLAELPNLTK